MEEINLIDIKNIHIIGISGICMSAIAKILNGLNKNVSGSDIIYDNKILKELKNIGIKIFYGHFESNINKKIDLIIYSNSIDINNIEIIKSKEYKINLYNKSDFFNLILKKFNTISISGTHGKTTISSILTNIFIKSDININFIIGGYLKEYNNNFNFLNNNKYFIVEADESDNTFFNIKTNYFILNNINNDHIRNYKNNFNNLKNNFLNYLNSNKLKISFICIDNFIIKNFIHKIKNKFITYGFNHKSDFCIDKKFYLYKDKTIFTLHDNINNDKIDIEITNCMGKYNIVNTVAAISLLLYNNLISKEKIIKSLKDFKGILKRFEILDNNIIFNFINKKIKNILLIRDYGHHPYEINNFIYNIKKIYKNRRIVMIFQPHRYTRTYDLFFYFANILKKVNILIILEIFSANENNIFNISSYKLYKYIKNTFNIKDIFYVKNIFYTKNILKKKLLENDIILIQGAGNIQNDIYNL